MKNDVLKIGLGMVIGALLAILTYITLIRPDEPKNKHSNQRTEVILSDEYNQPLIIESGKNTITPSRIVITEPVQRNVKPSQPKHPDLKSDTLNGGIRLNGLGSALSSDSLYRSGLLATGKINFLDTSYGISFTKGNPITYSNKFLTQYPTAPKFLYGKFANDSIQLHLMEADGTIYKQFFDVDQHNYTYETNTGRSLAFSSNPKTQPRESLESAKKSFTESNLYITYDPIQKAGRARVDYSFMFKNTGLYFSNQLQTRFPVYSAEVGLRIKLR